MTGYVLDPRVDEYRLYRAYNDVGDLLYIGQTSRAAVARWAEHMDEQPWAHEVAQWVRDPRVWPSERAVCRAEEAAIKAEWPRYNYEHNLRNPHRVPVYRQRRRAGAPTWPQPRLVRRQAAVRRAGWWAGGWATLALTLTLWIWLGLHVPFAGAGLAGLTIASAVVWYAAVRVRRWRRQRRRPRWR